jgi:hypothetical protein
VVRIAQPQRAGVGALERAREVDPVVGPAVLLAQHDDPVGAVQVALDRRLEEVVPDHAVPGHHQDRAAGIVGGVVVDVVRRHGRRLSIGPGREGCRCDHRDGRHVGAGHAGTFPDRCFARTTPE